MVFWTFPQIVHKLLSKLVIFHLKKRHIEETGYTKMYLTQVGKNMPSSIDFLKKICSRPGRTRLAKLRKNGGKIWWHSHCQTKRYRPTEYLFGIVHVPIYSNPDVSYQVCAVENEKNHRNIYSQKYEPGSVWIFNGWHDHRAVNYGERDRLTLVSYCHLTDTRFRNILENAVQKYTGPRILV